MDKKTIKQRFIESLRSSTQEELKADLLSSEPTGFGGIFYESEIYAESASRLNGMTGSFTRSTVRRKKAISVYSEQRLFTTNEALSRLEEGVIAA